MSEPAKEKPHIDIPPGFYYLMERIDKVETNLKETK